MQIPETSAIAPSDERQPGTATDYPTPPANAVVEVFSGCLVWLISLILLLLIPVAFVLVYAIRRGITPSLPNYANALAEFALKDPNAIFVQVFAYIPAHLLTLVVIWAAVTRFGRVPFWATLRWSWSRRFGLWTSIITGVALYFLATLVAQLLGGDKPTQLDLLINSSPWARYTIAFLATFSAPFVEEFIYRGLLYSAWEQLIGRLGAVIIVFALFTLVHVMQYSGNYGVIAAIGLLSLALTLIRAYTGRLLPCFIVHLVFNGVQSVIILIKPQIPPPLAPDHGMIVIRFLHLLGL